jgi:hypothetical protein
MKYQGSCHCGAIKFEAEAEGEIGSGMACNCSMCERKGSLLWFVPRGDMHLLTPDANASTYLFNKHVIKHRFCPTCGIHTHGEASSPSGEPTAAINLRCIEGIDLQAIPVKQFDGRAR